jgi:alpha-D-ribose 1-methylphosphonate 5-triphosphate synthase subunit PhnG
MPPELAARARAAAHAYRLGMNGQASAELAALLDGLIAACSRSTLVTARLAPILGELASAQRRGDWLALSDLIEFEISPVLAP